MRIAKPLLLTTTPIGLIVGSLGQALFAMARGPGHSAEMARSLTTRISFSVGLFVLLLVTSHFGWIEPHTN